MKKLRFLIFIAFAAFSVQACKNKTKDMTKAADSANYTKDTSNHPANTGGIAVDKDDARFAVEAANGGMAEVGMGKLAEQLAANPKVKSFGEMMVNDHSKANDELKKLARDKNITLPEAISLDEQKTETDLSKKKGKDFDKAYVSNMIDDHKKDVKAFEDAIKNLKDPDLKAFAEKTLPTLKHHLNSIEAIHDSMK